MGGDSHSCSYDNGKQKHGGETASWHNPKDVVGCELACQTTVIYFSDF